MINSDKLLKSYSDRTYLHTQMLTHRGVPVAFAMDDRRRIFYAVLDLNDSSGNKGEFDVDYWPEDPAELEFPDEIEKVGYSVLGATRIPVVKLGSTQEVADPSTLQPDEIDHFLSSTARLSDATPFQVFSDNQHIFLFRQAISGDHDDALHQLDDGSVSGNAAADNGEKVALVDRTLLCDRFVLLGKSLQRNREVRYQRSRHKTRPAGQTDSLGAKDMEGRPFYEPTRELSFVCNLTHGDFSVLQLPTQVNGIKRWQIFAHNSVQQCIDAFNLEVADGGLFNPRGTQLYTSPDPNFHHAVLEREPGKDPYTGKDLIPVEETTDHAETALELDGHTNFVTLAFSPEWSPAQFTIEFWVRADESDLTGNNGGGIFGSSDPIFKSNNTYINSFELVSDRQGNWVLIYEHQPLPVGPMSLEWQHVAITYDGSIIKTIIDGSISMQKPAHVQDQFDILKFGSNIAGNQKFSGKIDEVRIWNRALSASEINAKRFWRLIGDEPGLFCYWRFDEGAGNTVFDHSGNNNNGRVEGSPKWVASQAPIGDHPGIRRNTFKFSGRTLAKSSLSAKLYFQQEEVSTGYDGNDKPMKKSARVMLAAATTGDKGKDPAVAVADFGVSAEGRLAKAHDILELPSLTEPEQAQNLDNIPDIESQISALKDDFNDLSRQCDAQQKLLTRFNQLTGDVRSLTAQASQLARQEQNETNNIINYPFRILFKSNPGLALTVSNNGNTVSFSQPKDDNSTWKLEPYGTEGGVYRIVSLGLTQGGTNYLLSSGSNGSNFFVSSTIRDSDKSEFVVPDMRGNHLIQLHLKSTNYVLTKQENSNVAILSDGDNFDDAYIFLSPVSTTPINTCISDLQAQRTEAISNLTEKQNELATLSYDPSQTSRLLAEKLQKQQELANKQAELGNLTAGLYQDIRLPLGFVHLDASGLTINGGLIKFADTTDTPFILDGATGELALYYRGQSGGFMAAYFQTLVARTRLNLPNSNVTLLARSAGSNALTATIENGADDNTCTLSVVNTGLEITETWNNLPRAPQAFADILNGQDNAENNPENKPSPSVTPSSYSIKNRSLQIVALPDEQSKAIVNEEASIIPGKDGSWIANKPGGAYDFNGWTDALALPDNQQDRTAMKSDLTVEAWVNLQAKPGFSRLIHHCSGKAAYSLALKKLGPTSSLICNGRRDYVEIPYHAALNPEKFTISCWAKVKVQQITFRSALCSRGANPNKGFNFYAGNDSVWYLWLGAGQTNSEWIYLKGAAIEPNTWTHLAGTYDGETACFYVNGQLVDNKTLSFVPNDQYPLRIGAGTTETSPNYYFNGEIKDVAIWNGSRTLDQIQSDMQASLEGNEEGLVAFFTFTSQEAIEIRNKYAGLIYGNPVIGSPPDILQNYALIAGVSQGLESSHQGERWLVSKEYLATGQWQHIAMRFSQSHALCFDGQSYLDCGDNEMLDIGEDLTIEAFFQLDSLDGAQGILGKGYLGQPENSVPYQFNIAADGSLEFTFEDADGNSHTIGSEQNLLAGKFYRVAVTRKKGSTQNQEHGQQEIEVTNPDGTTEKRTISTILSVKVDDWFDITFYIDGVESNQLRYNGEAPSGNDQSLEIGRSRVSPRQFLYFKGAISEVRIWNTARDKKDLGQKIQGGESGLISWWQFEENQGHVASDSKSSNHGKIKGASWIKNPDPKGSPFELLLNGLPLAAETPRDTPDWGDAQFSIAAYQNESHYSQHFNGILEEVRIWRTLRTDEQIFDNLFTRLKGEKRDLLAYYTFDQVSPSDAEKVVDGGLLGNDLNFVDTKPTVVLSTAPISNDTAVVRSALTSVPTTFHEEIDTTPAVVEYADLQRDSLGNLGGVLKRCYSYLQNGKWRLLTGYKVGNLVTEWIGQAQFAPQVIGFIEGAPPVPSENLTVGATEEDSGFSEVEFVESETVTYTLSSSKDKSLDLGFKGAGSYSGGSDDLLITAPLGIGTAKKLDQVNISAAVSGEFNSSNTWSQEENLGTGINRTRNMSVTMSGSWESSESGRQLNPAIGPRVKPDNKGFALVQSQTADIFAMRLAHNNALVSFRMLPNPDIPVDWNIISFPINPLYTKQGTLDGRIGYNQDGTVCPDPSYENVHGNGEYSYYKPKEAYAIERRIQREEQRLINYYTNQDTEIADTGQVIGAAAGAAAGLLAGPAGMAVGAGIGSIVGGVGDALSKSVSLELPKKYAKRDLVNTYVWTADGGFFAETTETTDVKSEVTAGSFTFSGAVGGSFSTDVEIFSIGFSLEFEASVGGGFSLTKSKSKDAEKSFSLSVSMDIPRSLQKVELRDGSWGPAFDGNNKPVTAPGKVDAYRFKTFYLDCSERNFDDLFRKVVDPTWLKSPDPNAEALRQANQADKKPPCWRVFHRVTFVSRVLPDFPDNAGAVPTVDQVLKADNIDSDWLLFQFLDPFVRDKTQDAAIFAEAVRNTLQTYRPALSSHADDIIDRAALYFGVDLEFR